MDSANVLGPEMRWVSVPRVEDGMLMFLGKSEWSLEFDTLRSERLTDEDFSDADIKLLAPGVMVRRYTGLAQQGSQRLHVIAYRVVPC